MNKIRDFGRKTFSRSLTIRALQWLVPVALLLIGLNFFHVRLFRDGMDYIHGDMGDSRLVGMLLEHSFRYIFAQEQGLSYWSPSWIYFPSKNGLAFADVMSGASFLYAPWRIAGFSPMNSYQFWFVASSTANFAAFMLVARYLGSTVIGAAVGAYAVSFTMSVISYSNHPQLLSHYFLLLTFYFLLRLFDSSSLGSRNRFAFAAAFTYSMQFWSSFYLLWFYTLISGLVVLILAVWYHKKIAKNMRVFFWPALTFAVTSALLIYPLVRRYLIIKSEMGPRIWADVNHFLPGWQALFLPTPESIFYKEKLFDKISPSFPLFSEICMFSGFLMLASPLIFLISHLAYKKKLTRAPLFYALTFSFIIFICSPIKWPYNGGNFTLWEYIYAFVPGADAIRAVGRICLIVQMVGAFLLAISLSIMQRGFRFGWLVSSFLGLALIVENSVDHTYFYKISESNVRIDLLEKQVQETGKDCKVIHRSYRQEEFPYREIDSMALAQRNRIPTSNGYSGGMPPAYWNLKIFMAQSADPVIYWFGLNNKTLDPANLCFLP